MPFIDTFVLLDDRNIIIAEISSLDVIIIVLLKWKIFI